MQQPMTALCVALWALAGALTLGMGAAQVPVPHSLPGFTLGGGTASARVQLEMYIDLLCPFSKKAYYAGVKALAAHYSREQLRVRAVVFPLPYHQHGFTSAESMITITSALGEEQFTPWMEAVYANQERFWNQATKDKTPTQVTEELRVLAQKTFPSLTTSQWEHGMTGYGGTEADQQARSAWKYVCTRSISGTPQYTLNGVPFPTADSSWNLQDWLKVVDPLLDLPKVA